MTTRATAGIAIVSDRRERKPLTTLCVLGGERSGNDTRLFAAATELGVAIASSGIRLVYRGGSHGLAGAAALAAASHGGEVVAVMSSLRATTVPLPAPHRAVLVDGAAAQEEALATLCEAYVALPGGVGTLSDIARILGRTSEQHRAVLLADFQGYWRPLLGLFDHFIEAGFSDGAGLDRVIVTQAVHNILPLLNRATYFREDTGLEQRPALARAGRQAVRHAAS